VCVRALKGQGEGTLDERAEGSLAFIAR
jgi:hypothetical protein